MGRWSATFCRREAHRDDGALRSSPGRRQTDIRLILRGEATTGAFALELRSDRAVETRRGPKVWVFGSVAKGRRLDFRSAIDFAVEGIASEKFLRVGEELLDFSVDLVEIEDADPVLRDQIFRHGFFISREN